MNLPSLILLGNNFIHEYKDRQKIPKLTLLPSLELAELMGIILGDGEVRPDCVRISFDPKKDKNFIYRRVFYLNDLLIPSSITSESQKRICINSMAFVRYLTEDCKIKPGSKARNNSTVPVWCLSNIPLAKATIRGIFDTDGYIGYKGHSIEIMFGRFTDKCTNLVNDIDFILNLLEIDHSIAHTKDGRYTINIVGTNNTIKFFMIVGSSNLKHIVRFLLWRLIRYEAKIEREGLNFLISKINPLLDFDITQIQIPFIWNKTNKNFIEQINEDIIYLYSLKIREQYDWSKFFSLLNSQLIRRISKDLNIGERSVRRWREGSRLPAPRFIPYLQKLSNQLNIG